MSLNRFCFSWMMLGLGCPQLPESPSVDRPIGRPKAISCQPAAPILGTVQNRFKTDNYAERLLL